MTSLDRTANTARRLGTALMLISAVGTIASLLVWLFFGWFWAFHVLVLVCTLLIMLLFSFAGLGIYQVCRERLNPSRRATPRADVGGQARAPARTWRTTAAVAPSAPRAARHEPVTPGPRDNRPARPPGPRA